MKNYELEQSIVELLDSYREKLPESCRSWLAITATVDLSRNAVYDIIYSDVDVRRETVILLGFALEMTLEDFLILFNYKGFCFRNGILRDEITCKFFEMHIYDHVQWAKALLDSGEEPPFNFNKPIK